MKLLCWVGTGASLLWGVWAQAQDTRVVSEPKLPPACVVLKARLPMHGGELNAADEGKLDTVRIQDALDCCPVGQAVALRAEGANSGFLSGPLELRAGVVLELDRGATLVASRDAAVYAVSPGSCGIVNAGGSGCRPLLRAGGVRGAGVMGEGVIDGRGGDTVLGAKASWWELAEEARSGGRQQVPRLVVADHADDFTLYGITLKNSPNFHVVYDHGDGLTVWGVRIDTPKRHARNTDGIDPGNGSKNITITRSFIRTGDDDVAIKGGPGGVTQMTVSHNHFYWGHGMSIGSETNGGVSGIRVVDLSLDGPDNGIRVKSNGSRGGVVQDVRYEDVCIRDSPNPIVFDAGYTAAGTPMGDSPPTFDGIVLANVRISGGGRLTFDGYDASHGLRVTMDGVLHTDSAAYEATAKHAQVTLGPGPVNFVLAAGVDAKVLGKPREGHADSCAEKFVPFPAE